jgi:tetraacyldisaccharide 4'-kinase
LNPLSAVYATAARARRSWYEHHPASRRRLRQPVISVGNLVVGGSGKTPVVAALAEQLHAAGERPAILSRGYARRTPAPGVVVVSDGSRVLEPVERSGDEPQLLARLLTDVPVLVAADRHAAGIVAEERFDCTVLLLDDGFQHFQLHRDIDLLVVGQSDLDERVLPFGRLREPIGAASAADALLVTGSRDGAARVAAALGVADLFSVCVHYGEPRRVAPPNGAPPATARRRSVAVAGIARPQRFFAALRRQGWDVARELVFRDHHWFTPKDVAQVEQAARDAEADWILTTEKDAVRLPSSIADTWLRLPMRVTIEPAAPFAAWLAARLAAAREK